MQIHLFGKFRVAVAGQPVPDAAWRGKMPRALVQYLAVQPGRSATVDQLTDALWGHLPPEKGRQNLRVVATHARAALGGSLPFTGTGYELPPAWVDLHDDPNLLLPPDQLLTEHPYADWAAAARDAYRQVLLQRLRDRAEAQASLDLWKHLLELEPANEPAVRQAMRLAFARGDRAGALALFEQCRAALADDLGIDPMPETAALHTEILLADEGPAPQRPGLPEPLTSFVGREAELEEIARLLRGPARLVTLTGAGGAGKTRLALETARRFAGVDPFPDGVWFADLTPVQTADVLARTVAAALGLPPDRADGAGLAARVGARRMLLVLDNCEHLVEAAARLTRDLLSACPGLNVLATSRHALGLLGAEAVYRVPEMAEAEAFRLFCDRAATVAAGSAAPDPEIHRIIRRLDFMPLAIELAAARAHVLPPSEIAVRLDNRFRLLRSADPAAPPRQQTLRGAMEWSHMLLPPAEQMAWRRLSVFAGGFTLAAAEAVLDDDGLDLLQALVDKSLLVAAPGRYRMLETIREYGAERLAEAGEAAGARDRHLRYFVDFSAEAEPRLAGPEQIAWCDRVEADLDNLRAALAWARESRQGESGLRIFGSLLNFYYGRNCAREGAQWADELLALPAVLPAVRAKALTTAAFLRFVTGDLAGAQAMAAEGVALHREHGGPRDLARVEAVSGVLAVARGEAEVARGHLTRTLAIERELGPGQSAILALLWLGILERRLGNLTAAAASLDEAVALARRVGDLSSLAASLNWRGRLALASRDLDHARCTLREGLHLYWRLRNRQFAAASLSCLALVACQEGDAATAARLLGATDALLGSIALPLMPHLRAEYDAAEAGARAALTPEAYEAARGEGLAMPTEAAISLAAGR